MIIPVTLTSFHVLPDHTDESAVETLCVAIALRVIGCSKMLGDSENLHNRFHELVLEWRTIVSDENSRCAMACDHSLHKHACCCCGVLLRQGDCLSPLGEMIREHQNELVAAVGLRQRANKVHAHSVPWVGRNNGLEQTFGCFVRA